MSRDHRPRFARLRADLSHRACGTRFAVAQCGVVPGAALPAGRQNPAEDRFRNQPLPFRLGRANWSFCPTPDPRLTRNKGRHGVELSRSPTTPQLAAPWRIPKCCLPRARLFSKNNPHRTGLATSARAPAPGGFALRNAARSRPPAPAGCRLRRASDFLDPRFPTPRTRASARPPLTVRASPLPSAAAIAGVFGWRAPGPDAPPW
jgi:hypothetical protein